MKLLTSGKSNAKLKKNRRESHILYMAPFNQNERGINLCPKATDGCAAACLFTAGHGAFNNVQQARIRKSNYFVSERDAFLGDLTSELTKLEAKAKRKGERIAVRLNGTSDLDFMKLLSLRNSASPIEMFPTLDFYDYTKVISRAVKYQPTNYRITFSRSETNQEECEKALDAGVPVSVVFDVPKGEDLPERWMGYPVIDGDASDDQMLDIPGAYILGLRLKGHNNEKKAARESGFAIPIN